jgi:hypothetical protein
LQYFIGLYRILCYVELLNQLKVLSLRGFR